MNPASPHTNGHGAPRILHLASTERWTGVADPVASLAKNQEALGCEVWLGCSLSRSFEREAKRRGLRVLDFLDLDTSSTPIQWWRDVRRISRFVRENRIQIVHCHLNHDHWLAALACRGLKRQVMLARTLHHPAPPRRDAAHRWLFRRATDLLIALSAESRSAVASSLDAAEESIPVVGGAVDTDRFNPSVDGARFRRSIGVEEGQVLGGQVARIVSGRGHVWVLDAFVLAAAEIPGLRLAFVGRGPMQKTLRREIAQREARGKALMAGYRKGDLPEAYAGMDFHILAAPGSEGSCRAALEAMAAGRPNIAVRAGALLDTIRHEVDGLLVPEGDVKAMAEAIVRMARHPEETRRMGENARKAIEDRYREEVRALSVLTAYERAWNLGVGLGRAPWPASGGPSTATTA